MCITLLKPNVLADPYQYDEHIQILGVFFFFFIIFYQILIEQYASK